MSPAVVALCLLLLSGSSTCVSAAEWTYEDGSTAFALGPEDWPGVCVAGAQQSPIDLKPDIGHAGHFESLVLINYDRKMTMNITNDGHTVKVLVEQPCAVAMAAGGLPSVYHLDQIHFHWESEHTLDGRRWPLEMHLVHHDRKYSSVKEAVRHNQGIAVLAVLFYEASSPNTELEPILEAMSKVKSTPSATAKIITKIAPQDLLPNQLNRFYRYSGSLTTPGCDEVVVWTVLTHPVPISPQQVEQFHQIQSQNGPIERNYRPIQKLNNRRIYVQYPPDGTHNLAYLTNRVAPKCSASVIMMLVIVLTSYVLNVKYFS